MEVEQFAERLKQDGWEIRDRYDMDWLRLEVAVTKQYKGFIYAIVARADGKDGLDENVVNRFKFLMDNFPECRVLFKEVHSKVDGEDLGLTSHHFVVNKESKPLVGAY